MRMATSTLFVVFGLVLCGVYGWQNARQRFKLEARFARQRFSRRSGRQSSDVIVDVDVRTDQSSSSRDSSRGFDSGFDGFGRFDRGGRFDRVGGFDRGFDRGFGSRSFIDPIGVGGSGLIGVGGVGIGVLPVGGVIGGFGGGRSFFGGRRRRGRPECRGIRRRGDCARRAFLGRPRSCVSDVGCPIRRVCCFDGCRRACYRPTTFF